MKDNAYWIPIVIVLTHRSESLPVKYVSYFGVDSIELIKNRYKLQYNRP